MLSSRSRDSCLLLKLRRSALWKSTMKPVAPIDAPPVLKPNPFKKFVRTHLLERTMRRIPRGNRVLDLCCGWGFYFNINPNAVGVDGDPHPVEQLRERGFNVHQANVLETLPFGPGSFQWVLAHDVLEHFTFDELQRLVANVHYVLAPGGRFVVWVPNRKGYDFGLDIGAGHKLYVTEDEIRRLTRDLFLLERNYAEPLPRAVGKSFTHNKEVFFLRKLAADE